MIGSAGRTRVVVPLLPADEMAATISGLNPVLSFGGKDHVFMAQSLATMTKAEMGDQIGTVLNHYDDRCGPWTCFQAGSEIRAPRRGTAVLRRVLQRRLEPPLTSAPRARTNTPARRLDGR